MRFFATEGGALNRCGISIAALAKLEANALGGADEIVTCFFKHRDLFPDIAERKYRARRFETGGSVIVRLQDLAAYISV